MTKVDVDASSMPSQDDSDALPADSPFAPLDADYGPAGDAAGPFAVCAQCMCGPGTFCFGGSPSSTLTSCDQTGAAAGAGGVGCHPVPSTCDGGSDCVCLLQSLAHELSCYPVCELPAGKSVVVYCPR
jgi:hypothetical protein